MDGGQACSHMQGTQLEAHLWPPTIVSEAYMQHHQQHRKRYSGQVHVLHEQPHPANPAVPARQNCRRGQAFTTAAKDSNSFYGTAMENHGRGCSMPSYDAVGIVYDRQPQQGTHI